MSDGPVHHFAFQEPIDDPRPTIYVWIAHGVNEKRFLPFGVYFVIAYFCFWPMWFRWL